MADIARSSLSIWVILMRSPFGGTEALLNWIMDAGGSYYMTPRGIYVKLQSSKVKVINGSMVILSGTRKDNCVYSLDGHAMESELNASVEEKDSLVQARYSGSDRLYSFKLMGASQVESLGVKRYFLSIVDAYSRRAERTVKKLGTYNGLEFCNREFEQLCTKSGIAKHLMVVGTPQQIGLAKCMIRTLMDKFEVELKGLNNRTLEEDQTYQEDGDDEDAGDRETNQTSDLTDYQLVRNREPRTKMKPLRFRDESNMVAYAFVVAEEEYTHEPLTYLEAVAYEDISKWKAVMKEEMDSMRKNKT
nr:retrovirus-related Pol polyprotein from transposon TNT 1-94 [Tanacetum cinerariifolium]